MTAASDGERRALSAFRFARDQGPALLSGAGAIALGLWQLAAPPASVIIAIVGAGVAVAGVVLALLRPTEAQIREETARTIADADAKIAALRARVVRYEEASNERVRFLLHELLDDLRLAGPRQRASVFMPGPNGDEGWHLVARYSADARLTGPGRSAYAADQGLVVETWSVGQSYRTDLPARRPNWDDFVSTSFHMPAAEVRKLRMQSRSYGCVRLDRPEGATERSVGVLIVESTEPRGVRAEMLDAMLSHASVPLLASECAFQQGLAAMA